MTAQKLTTFSGSATDVGAYRDNNEDSFSVVGTLHIVADGMGGHEAGEHASRLCARTIAYNHLFSRPCGMTDAEQENYARELAAEDNASTDSNQGLLGRRRKKTTALNRQIMRTLEHIRSIIGESDERIKEMFSQRAGTTVTGAWLTNIGDQYMWFIFNVGDSRTYRLVREEDVETDAHNMSFSAGSVEGLTLEQITVDHSEVQYLVDTGQITAMEALTHPRRNVITRALGTGNYWEPDFWVIPAHEGDRLMLCSDGLSGELSHDYMARVLATVEHPQDAAEVLQTAALRAGGRDNITVVVADVVTEKTAQERAEHLKALTSTEQHHIVSSAEEYQSQSTTVAEQESYHDERELR
ncbi:PP2C family protein-serine/threonine phosphatase [Rothia sp. P6271]|uniref:PP2C family protein-serine/threonine phosphatase n=1 Tax=unclassified Rothia (in: high G+C Gram-positive bacteria) TaxID=2689056 RepID=UPI003AC584C8